MEYSPKIMKYKYVVSLVILYQSLILNYSVQFHSFKLNSLVTNLMLNKKEKRGKRKKKRKHKKKGEKKK